MKNIAVEIVAPEVAAQNGFYNWVGANNDCEFFGQVPGYEMGFCVEVLKADGTIGYSSVDFISEVPAELHIAETNEDECEIDHYGIDGMANLCNHSGNTITGRLVFRGYYESYYDFEEREECVREKSAEVVALFNKYVH